MSRTVDAGLVRGRTLDERVRGGHGPHDVADGRAQREPPRRPQAALRSRGSSTSGLSKAALPDAAVHEEAAAARASGCGRRGGSRGLAAGLVAAARGRRGGGGGPEGRGGARAGWHPRREALASTRRGQRDLLRPRPAPRERDPVRGEQRRRARVAPRAAAAPRASSSQRPRALLPARDAPRRHADESSPARAAAARRDDAAPGNRRDGAAARRPSRGPSARPRTGTRSSRVS